MPGQPNVNPFVHDYAEKLNPFISLALDQLHPELEDLANIEISKLPWLRRNVVRAAWWPILKILSLRLADAILEAFLAWRGEVKVENCSGPTRYAFVAMKSAPPTMKASGDPHTLDSYMIDSSSVASDDPARRREKMIRTIDRGRTLYRADCKAGWLADPSDPRVKRFKCYEVAFTYYLSIPVEDRIGDPKIVDSACPAVATVRDTPLVSTAPASIDWNIH